VIELVSELVVNSRESASAQPKISPNHALSPFEIKVRNGQ
jgi:hypothetical protein